MNCKKAAQLASEKRDHKLTWRQQLSLVRHMLMCKVCRAYMKQLDILSRLSRQAGDFVMNRPAVNLPDDAKERIKRRMTEPD